MLAMRLLTEGPTGGLLHTLKKLFSGLSWYSVASKTFRKERTALSPSHAYGYLSAAHMYEKHVHCTTFAQHRYTPKEFFYLTDRVFTSSTAGITTGSGR